MARGMAPEAAEAAGNVKYCLLRAIARVFGLPETEHLVLWEYLTMKQKTAAVAAAAVQLFQSKDLKLRPAKKLQSLSEKAEKAAEPLH